MAKQVDKFLKDLRRLRRAIKAGKVKRVTLCFKVAKSRKKKLSIME